jgi:hypothetical protein
VQIRGRPLQLTGVLVEYLVTGAIALTWLLPLLHSIGFDVRSFGGGIWAALLPGIYILGMTVDSTARFLLSTHRSAIKSRVNTAQEAVGDHDVEVELLVAAPELAKGFQIRSSRDRVARGLVVNAALGVLMAPLTAHALSVSFGKLVLFWITTAVFAVLAWRRFERLTTEFGTAAVTRLRVAREVLHPALPNSVATAVETALENILRFTVTPLPEAVANVLQHVADVVDTTSSTTTTVPAVLVSRVTRSGVDILSRTVSAAELAALSEKFFSMRELHSDIRRTAEEGLLMQIGDASHRRNASAEPSFKLRTIDDNATYVHMKVSGDAGADNTVVVTLVVPNIHFDAQALRRAVSAAISSQRDRHASPRKRPTDSMYIPSSSSFKFLEPILDAVVARIGSYAVVRKIPTPLFAVTFLFRSGGRSSGWFFVFTKQQRVALEAIPVRDVSRDGYSAIGRVMQSALVHPLSTEGKSRLNEWLQTQSHMSAYDLLAGGRWYGEQSFATYASKLSPGQSVYISDWRIWYSSESPWRSPEEQSRFEAWVGGDSIPGGEEPIVRLLRSEVEQALFGVTSVLMQPIGITTDEPLGVVQVSVPQMTSEERIRIVEILSIVESEIAGYFRADELRLRLQERAQFDQFLEFAHLFTHAGTKLFATPLHNSMTRLKDVASKARVPLALWAANDAMLTVRTMETQLGLLTRFGSNRSTSHGDAPPRLTSMIAWTNIDRELSAIVPTLITRHFWDVCHDPEERHLRDVFVSGELLPRELVTFNFSYDEPLPPCAGHTELLTMHLANIVENAIESIDLHKAAKNWLASDDPEFYVNVTVSCEAGEEQQWIVVTIENNGVVLESERLVLRKLQERLKALAELRTDEFLAEYRDSMRKREFTSKSGGAHGWAVLEAASYARRLEIYRGPVWQRCGSLQLSLDDDGKPLMFRFALPVPGPDEATVFTEARSIA